MPLLSFSLPRQQPLELYPLQLLCLRLLLLQSLQKNPMKATKAAKTAKAATAVVEFGNTATQILVEESAAQVKAVNTIIETLKSGKNL